MTSLFVSRFTQVFGDMESTLPWHITEKLTDIIAGFIQQLDAGFEINGDIAIHQSAVIEQNVVIKGPAIVGRNVFIGANAYLRGPVYLDENVKIGAGCEIKQSVIFSDTAVAHFNYIGNSVIGSRVNFEAGSVAANHYNERHDKHIIALHDGKKIPTNVTKFGSLVGDDAKIGANAVLSPGTILPPKSVVARLQLVNQLA